MVAVTVTAENTRIAEAKITPDTGTWGNDGGGGGVSDEPDFYYQNDTAQSRKVSTSPIGRDYLVEVQEGTGLNLDQSTKLNLIYKILGLDSSDKITHTPSGIDSESGDIDINITGDGETSSVLERQP